MERSGWVWPPLACCVGTARGGHTSPRPRTSARARDARRTCACVAWSRTVRGPCGRRNLAQGLLRLDPAPGRAQQVQVAGSQRVVQAMTLSSRGELLGGRAISGGHEQRRRPQSWTLMGGASDALGTDVTSIIYGNRRSDVARRLRGGTERARWAPVAPPAALTTLAHRRRECGRRRRPRASA